MNRNPAREQNLVSVIVVFLNGERYLREAIESVFSQTFGNWELLLVDDGSTDSSTRIALDYVAAHPGKVRYFEHEAHANLGPSAARNLGIRHARGELIALLDADDVWLPQKLELQAAILQSHPEAGMVFGASEYWRSWSAAEGASEPDSVVHVGVASDSLFEPPELMRLLYPLGEHPAPCPSDLMFRHDAFIRCGGFQEEFRGNYRLYEDQAFLARMYLRETIFVSSGCLTRYRVHPDSCMASFERSGNYPVARLFFLRYLERYLDSEQMRDPAIWNLLRKALWKLGCSVSIAGMREMDVRDLRWELRVAGGSEASLVLPPDDPDLIRVAIARIGSGAPWDIQLNQPNLKVSGGQRYRISFRARAENRRTVNLGFSKAHEPWDGLGLYQSIDLTALWELYTFEFTCPASDENARIHFDLGGAPALVEIASVTIRTEPEGCILSPDFTVQGQYPAERWLDRPAHVPERKDPSARFSVIIPSYQRRDLVVAGVKALALQDFPANFEVIVVVDGSRDGSAEALRALQMPFPLTVLEQPNQGAAAARNHGASVSSGQILLFLDDDMEAHPRLLAEHDRSHRDGADVVLGHLPLDPNSPATFLSAGVKLWAEERARLLSKPGAEPLLHDLLTGQISVKREVFQRVAGFDPNFTKGGTFGNEDIDLGHRLVAAGCRIVFNLYAISYQKYIITPRQYLQQTRQAGQADVAFARKHPDEACTIFASRPKRVFQPRTWRVLASLSVGLAPLWYAVRSVALAYSERPKPSPRAVRFYFGICELEYWRGVRDAGGIPRRPAVRILAYHAIQDLAGGLLEAYGTPPREFRRQIRLLRKLGFHFIAPDQFLQFSRTGGPLPPRPLLITFDDCYQDLLDCALPVLKEFGVPAIAFAVSSKLGAFNTWDSKDGAPMLPLLNAEGLKTLQKQGVEIGAHSRAHQSLANLPPEAIQEEVLGSVQDLETLGLKRPRMFAYPYGEWNAAAVRALKNSGVQAGFTIDAGLACQGGNPYLIPRIEIFRNDTGWRFLWKIIAVA